MTQFITSIFLTFCAFLSSYYLKRKPKLRFFFASISEIPLPPPTNITNEQRETLEQLKIAVQQSTPPLSTTHTRTHTIVISNQGNATAHNVKIGHYSLPLAHSVSPPMNVLNPGNPNEILIPYLCAKDFVTISYLYPRELSWQNINAYVCCEEGKAELANLQHVSIRSPIFILCIKIALLIGIFTVIYGIYGMVNFFIGLYKMLNI